MKRWGRIVTLVSLVMVASGCASVYPIGSLFTNVKLPVEATPSTETATKIRQAECISFLSLLAIGDAGIEAAMRNGGITTVHHVDWEAQNFLGIFGKYRVTVYGK